MIIIIIMLLFLLFIFPCISVPSKWLFYSLKLLKLIVLIHSFWLLIWDTVVKSQVWRLWLRVFTCFWHLVFFGAWICWSCMYFYFFCGSRRSMPLGVLRMINNNCCGEGTVAAIPWELLPHLGGGWWWYDWCMRHPEVRIN
jgi:hypothetical protein